MPSSTHIHCPNCNHSIELSEALQQQQQEEFERRLEEATQKATALASEAAERKAKREQKLELDRLKRQTEDQEAQIQSLQQKELDLLQQERKLKEAVRDQELELERKLSKRLEEKTLSIRKQEEARSSLKEEEYKKQLADQARLIADLQRKSEQGSMQLQGEVQELALEEYLRSRFPLDEITEVKKGARGADVRQLVKDQIGRAVGSILYESKRTKSFSDSWVSKLKEDLGQDPADLAVIVTEAMPKGLEQSGMYHGVFVCLFTDVKVIIPILRQMVQKVAFAAATQENKGDKMALLYDYLTGSEFKLKVETILDAFSSMKGDLEKEKRAIQRQWKNREKQLDRVLQSTAEMYGDLQGIGGASIPSIPQLELPG